MAPKNSNTKKEAGRAKKAENEAKKQAAVVAEKERKEAESWVDHDVKGGKAAKLAKEEKRKADLARKAENAKLLADEEATTPAKVKAAPKAGSKKPTPKPAGPDGGLDAAEYSKVTPQAEAESYAASGIDNALDLLEVVNAKTDKASVGQQAANIERHPERRFKAAFEAYQERELPKIKEDHPGLRLQQYKDMLHKQFQKSPDNPFNQATIAYDATKEERLEVLGQKHTEIKERLRDK